MSLGLKKIWRALTNFDYPNYEIYFSLASSLDPALKAIEQVKAASQHPVHIVIAGPAGRLQRKGFQPAPRSGIASRRISKCSSLPIPTCGCREAGCKKLIAPLQDAAHRRDHRLPLDHTQRRDGMRAVSRARWRPPGTRRWRRFSAARGKISAGAAARRSGGKPLTMRRCWKPGTAPPATISP